MNAEKQAKIEYVKGQMKQRELYVNYWLTVANTGHYKSHKVFHGTSTDPDKEFTDEEKLEHALETAKRHIHLHSEFNDSLNELLLDKT